MNKIVQLSPYYLQHTLTNQSKIQKLLFQFATKQKLKKFGEILKEKKLSQTLDFPGKSDPTLRAEPELSPELGADWLAQIGLSSQSLPEKVMKRCQQVFSKYPHKELRELCKEYLRFYQLLHAVERPSDLEAINLKVNHQFANSSDVIKANPEMLFQLKKRRMQMKEIGQKLTDRSKYDIWKVYQTNQSTEQNSNNNNNNNNNQSRTTQETLFEKLNKQPASTTVSNSNSNNKQTSHSAYKDDLVRGNNDPFLQLIDYDQNMSLAYMQRKFPDTFSVACRILVELKYRVPLFSPKSFLDYGAGLGSYSIAFADLFTNIEQICAVEPSTSMRKLGKFISQEYPQIQWVPTLSEAFFATKKFKYDIVAIGNVLEEIPSAEQRELILDSLWEKVNDGGYLIVVEPGSPMGFRFINDTRNKFLDQFKNEAKIFAPCPHAKACPMASLNKAWCNFGQGYQRYPKDILSKEAKERMNREAHYSYIVFKKETKRISNSDKSSEDVLINGPKQQSKFSQQVEAEKEIVIQNSQNQVYEEADNYFKDDGIDLEKLPITEQSYHWARVIRPIRRRGGHVLLDLCTSEGLIEKRVIARSTKSESGAYKQAKKIRWGDLWNYAYRIPNKFRKEKLFTKRLW